MSVHVVASPLDEIRCSIISGKKKIKLTFSGPNADERVANVLRAVVVDFDHFSAAKNTPQKPQARNIVHSQNPARATKNTASSHTPNLNTQNSLEATKDAVSSHKPNATAKALDLYREVIVPAARKVQFNALAPYKSLIIKSSFLGLAGLTAAVMFGQAATHTALIANGANVPKQRPLIG